VIDMKILELIDLEVWRFLGLTHLYPRYFGRERRIIHSREILLRLIGKFYGKKELLISPNNFFVQRVGELESVWCRIAVFTTNTPPKDLIGYYTKIKRGFLVITSDVRQISPSKKISFTKLVPIPLKGIWKKI